MTATGVFPHAVSFVICYVARPEALAFAADKCIVSHRTLLNGGVGLGSKVAVVDVLSEKGWDLVCPIGPRRCTIDHTDPAHATTAGPHQLRTKEAFLTSCLRSTARSFRVARYLGDGVVCRMETTTRNEFGTREL